MLRFIMVTWSVKTARSATEMSVNIKEQLLEHLCKFQSAYQKNFGIGNDFYLVKEIMK